MPDGGDGSRLEMADGLVEALLHPEGWWRMGVEGRKTEMKVESTASGHLSSQATAPGDPKAHPSEMRSILPLPIITSHLLRSVLSLPGERVPVRYCGHQDECEQEVDTPHPTPPHHYLGCHRCWRNKAAARRGALFAPQTSTTNGAAFSGAGGRG